MRPDILTFTGHYYNFLHPEKSVITLEDIAHALSNLCRFTGQCREFYSVAQHAVYTSYLVPAEFAYEALHHDDAEAVLGDVSSPLKRLLPEYKVIERRVEAAMRAQFGLPAIESPEVKHADLRMLATEKRDLMWVRPGATIVVYDPETDEDCIVTLTGDPWACIEGVEPAPLPIRPVLPAEAREMFLARHRELIEAKRRRWVA